MIRSKIHDEHHLSGKARPGWVSDLIHAGQGALMGAVLAAFIVVFIVGIEAARKRTDVAGVAPVPVAGNETAGQAVVPPHTHEEADRKFFGLGFISGTAFGFSLGCLMSGLSKP